MPYAQSRDKKRSARATSAATVGNGSDASATAVDASATAVPVHSGSSASSSSLSSCRMKSSSSGGSSCSTSVSSKRVPSRCSRVALAASLGASSNVEREVAPGFRCDAHVFLHLCAGMQNPVRHETLHGVEAKVKHRLVPTHGFGKELHGLLFDAVFQRLLNRDVCWLQLRCVATRNEEHVALRMSSTDPFQQGGLSMYRGTIPQQHPMQEPLFSHPSAKPLDQLLACALGAPVALAEGVGKIFLW